MCLATRDCVSLCQSLSGLLSLVLSMFVKCLHAQESPSDVSWASLSISTSLVHIQHLGARMRISISDVNWVFPLYQLVLYMIVYVSVSKDLLNSLSTTVSKGLLSLCLFLSLIIFYLFSNLLY